MRRASVLVVLSGIALLAVPNAARACIHADWLHVASSDYVFMGQFEKFEANPVRAKQYREDREQNLKVAVIKVGRSFRGAEGITHLRVACPTSMQFPNKQCLFVLADHFDGPFCVFATNYARRLISMKRELTSAEEVEYSRLCEILDDPVAGLTSPKPEKRLLTAALVINQLVFRSERTGKKEAMSVSMSKLVIDALAKADWTMKLKDDEDPIYAKKLFCQFRPDADTWRGKSSDVYAASAKDWLKEHADTFRVAPRVEHYPYID
jgi:hypothetical protein